MTWTMVLSFFSGVIVTLISQIIITFVIRPNNEIRTTISIIVGDLLYYLPRITNPDTIGTQEAKNLRDIFRGHAAVLRSRSSNLVCKICKPRKEDLQNASRSLIGLSNTLASPEHEWSLDHVLARKKELEEYLNIPLEMFE